MSKQHPHPHKRFQVFRKISADKTFLKQTMVNAPLFCINSLGQHCKVIKKKIYRQSTAVTCYLLLATVWLFQGNEVSLNHMWKISHRKPKYVGKRAVLKCRKLIVRATGVEAGWLIVGEFERAAGCWASLCSTKRRAEGLIISLSMSLSPSPQRPFCLFREPQPF